FTFIDPLGENEADQQSFFKTWCNYAKTRSDLVNIHWRMMNLQHTRQKDNFNCGVYVCVFGKMLLSGSTNLYINSLPESLKKIRSQISQTILDNSGN
ncbi:unnamed protein product, partial [Brachionus calyciflorus]